MPRSPGEFSPIAGIGLTLSPDIVAYPRRRSSKGSASWSAASTAGLVARALGPHQRCPRAPLSVLGKTSRTTIVSGRRLRRREHAPTRVGPVTRSEWRIDDGDPNDQEVTNAHPCRRRQSRRNVGCCSVQRLSGASGPAEKNFIGRPAPRVFCCVAISRLRKRRRIGAPGTARSLHRWIWILSPASRAAGGRPVVAGPKRWTLRCPPFWPGLALQPDVTQGKAVGLG